MNPTLGDVHVNRPLTNMMIRYSNEEYVADKIFPIVPVKKESDKYFTWDKPEWFRNEARATAPGGEAPRTGFGLSTGTYTVEEYKIATELPDRIAANADEPLNLPINKAKFVTDKIMLKKEINVATMIGTSGNWTGSAAVGTKWDAANSTPIDDIETSKITIAKRTGRRANTIVIGEEVMKELVLHSDIIDRIKYTGRDVPTEAMLAQLFRVKQVLVMSAIYNSAIEGATEVDAFVSADWCWVGYVAPAPSLDIPSAGYCFRVGNRRIRNWREESKEQTVYEASEMTDEVVTSAALGLLMTAAITVG